MKKIIKITSIVLVLIQLITIIGNIECVKANIKEGDIVTLKGDHECDSLVEYLTNDDWWSYKIVWYVYYTEGNNRYPAFCVEPAKQGVGTGYESYNALISRETDNVIWRILSKGYMGSKWTDWNLECDDDLYSATKIALHSYKDKAEPKSKYILGNRSVDGNTVEEIQRRGQRVLDVAQALYEYGLNGKETYHTPQVNIIPDGEYRIETLNGEEYYVQNYKVSANKTLKSYNVSIKDFVSETKILNLDNQVVSSLESSCFKIAIPIKNIKENVNGKIYITDANVKTYPVFYAKSSIEGAQSYATYTSCYEITNATAELKINANTAKLSITKIDSETGETLPNVTFEVFNKEGKSLGQYTTNEHGIIEINNLRPGIVKVKEIKVDEKYILDSEEREVQLEWGKLSQIEIGNAHKKSQIRIIKTSSDDNTITGQKAGTPIANVEFEVRNKDGQLVQTIITNEQGEAITDKLDIGQYTIKEIKTDENYYLDEKEYTVILENNKEIKTLNITNKSKQKLPRTGF